MISQYEGRNIQIILLWDKFCSVYSTVMPGLYNCHQVKSEQAATLNRTKVKPGRWCWGLDIRKTAEDTDLNVGKSLGITPGVLINVSLSRVF